MNKKHTIISLITVLMLIILPLSSVYAQSYRFKVTRYDVQAVIEADGTLTLFYEMDFENDPNGHAIDFVDLGMPNDNYQLSNISATINGTLVPEINHSSYVKGAELALGEYQIPPGGTGTVQAKIVGITGVLFPYDHDDRENYVNFQFMPNYFDSDADKSQNTDYELSIVLPPDVGSNEGVYYYPDRWPGEKDAVATLTVEDKRVIYEWHATNANTHTKYLFGVAFPASAVPESSVSSSKDLSQGQIDNTGSNSVQFFPKLLGNICSSMKFLVPLGIIILISIFSSKKQMQETEKRKLQYLKPTLSVEGHGIKRGLTAVEAAILLEESLDQVLTMILFGLLKKEAISVINQDPLVIETNSPLPEGLYDYETKFIEALGHEKKTSQRSALQILIVELIKSVEQKMKGFNAKDTKAYYKDIVQRAWSAVEGANTPEVKSAQFEHTLEWTMLDEDFSGRTTRTFMDTPVFIPRWWWRYDNTYRPYMSSPVADTAGSGNMASSVPGLASSSSSTSSKPSFSLPNIPGATFAASVISGGANMTNSIIGDSKVFTSQVTNRTNPIPKTSSSGSGRYTGGGGSSCACACACAGCACACAGGGR
ncbi:MAG: hypothetical protein GX884_06980 [Chloroflexi bacterium]|nr:hypothetical protein [Chloroflexota bacterium]